MTKEGIKQFFKPSGKKILLVFLMCFIVISVVSNIPIASDIYTYSVLDKLIINLYCPPCKIFVYCFELNGTDIKDAENIVLFIPFAILFAYYYFFSCLTIFLFNKIFGKTLNSIYNNIHNKIFEIFGKIKHKIDSMINESTRQFFKSTPVRKSLFLLLIILFFFFVPIFTVYSASFFPYSIFYLGYLPAFIFGYIMQLSPIFDNIPMGVSILGGLIMIIVIFAYWYFLSCLIIFLFNKFFGKITKRIDSMIGESTKQFFKPNRRKILLFISLTYIIPAVLLLITSSFDIDLALFLEIYYFPFSLIFKYSLISPFGELKGAIETGFMFVCIVFAIAYYYSLSCLLSFLLNKTFNKIKRKIDSTVGESSRRLIEKIDSTTGGNTKRFLKIDLKKILLFFLILFFLPNSITTDSSLILWVSHPFLSIVNYFKLHELTDVTGVIALIGWLITFIFVVLEFAYYYFLSCLLIFLYRKIRSKK